MILIFFITSCGSVSKNPDGTRGYPGSTLWFSSATSEQIYDFMFELCKGYLEKWDFDPYNDIRDCVQTEYDRNNEKLPARFLEKLMKENPTGPWTQ